MHPRLADARALVEAGAVMVDGDVARVRSGDVEYVVRTTADGDALHLPLVRQAPGLARAVQARARRELAAQPTECCANARRLRSAVR